MLSEHFLTQLSYYKKVQKLYKKLFETSFVYWSKKHRGRSNVNKKKQHRNIGWDSNFYASYAGSIVYYYYANSPFYTDNTASL